MSVASAVREFFRGKAQPIEQPYRPQAKNAIDSYDAPTLYRTFANGEKWNPDDLVGQKGLSIYSKMLVDEQVKSVTEFKLNAILGRGWQFKFDGETKLSREEQKKRIALFNTICSKIRGSFLDAIEGIASGREFGFSVTEKVYGQISYEGSTFTGLNMLLTRDPGSFKFFVDDYGLLQRIVQSVSGKPDLEIDRAKLVHYVHKPKWDTVYGRSELRAAYRAWYLKDVTLKLWALHLERFGSGIPVATRTGEGSPSGPDFDAFKLVMEQFKSHTSIILPAGYTAEVIFPTSTDQFQKALEYHDLAIAKSQLVPNLLGLSHTGQTGAYSQSQTQFEAFFWTTQTDGQRLAECLNEQLFRDLGDQNWGDGDYPYFCFKPLTLDSAIKLLTSFKDMIGAGAAQVTEDDERFIRELLELPERTEESEPLIDPMAERQQTHTEEQAQVANDLKQQEIDQRSEQAANAERYTAEPQPISITVHNPAPPPAGPQHTPPSVVSPAAGGAAVVPHGKLRSSTVEQFTRAAQRVAFSVIEKRTDDYAQAAVGNLAGIIAKATKRALGTDDTMRSLTDEDPSDVAALDLGSADRGKLKGAYRDVLMQSWTLGSNLAANELDRARGERSDLTLRRAHFVSLRDNASAYFETQSFRMAGDTSDAVRKIIQQELQNGIKFGKAIPEIRTAIWERLLSKGLTDIGAVKGIETDEAVVAALADLGLDVAEDVPAYLNTLVRTNTFEALNEARFAEFTDPAVSDFVQALEYAAVIDSSTSEICSELDGKVYRTDSDEWNVYRPPNHPNCRSVLVPVTTADEWDGQESSEPTVEPAAGFK